MYFKFINVGMQRPCLQQNVFDAVPFHYNHGCSGRSAPVAPSGNCNATLNFCRISLSCTSFFTTLFRCEPTAVACLKNCSLDPLHMQQKIVSSLSLGLSRPLQTSLRVSF